MAGEGSIFQRKDRKWVASLSIGGRTSRRFVRRSFPTRAEAVAGLEELKAERRARIRPSRQSLGDYLRWWLDESARSTISANTYRGYDDVLAHFQPIAGIPLRDLTAEDIEACCNRMTAHRGRAVAPAAPKTIRNAQLMLRRALSQAVERGYMHANVARQMPLRRIPERDVEALTPDMARRILGAVAGDRYEAAFALSLLGLRASEVLGLAVGDVDLVAQTVYVRYQLLGSGPKARRAQLKTRGSKATVPLPGFVLERIHAHVEQQRGRAVAAPAPTRASLTAGQRREAVRTSCATRRAAPRWTSTATPRSTRRG